MIKYDRLWKTMKEKGISQYALYTTFHINRSQLNRLRHNENVQVNTIDKLIDLPSALQPDGERRQIQPAGRLGTGFCHSGVGKAPAPRLRHRLRHPGGVSAQYLPALLPGGQVSQPGIRWRRTGALTGMGDRSSSLP